MGQNDVSLAALISSRICHDLISPIGAINNGLELLGMSDQRDGPEMDLIAQSVQNASARIRFFRVAYGAASDQSMGRAEVVTILRDITQEGRLSVDYAPLGDQPRSAVRMAFLAIQCLEASMPYGGRIEVACQAGTWTARGTAPNITPDPGLMAVLDGAEHGALAPAHVQFALLYAVAQDAGRALTTQTGDNQMCINF